MAKIYSYLAIQTEIANSLKFNCCNIPAIIMIPVLFFITFAMHSKFDQFFASIVCGLLG